MERLTAQEESVMLYIWKLGSCFIRDILNEMPDPKPPYTSVASVVRNLEKKKYVTPKKFGTITLFSPRVKEAARSTKEIAPVGHTGRQSPNPSQ